MPQKCLCLTVIVCSVLVYKSVAVCIVRLYTQVNATTMCTTFVYSSYCSEQSFMYITVTHDITYKLCITVNATKMLVSDSYCLQCSCIVISAGTD